MSPLEMLAERAAEAGPDDFADSFIRLMQWSASLRHEPEFADFYLDPMQTLEVAARHFPRFQRQMMRVLRRGGKPDAAKYDDYRIAVLDDMDTPQLRQQLRRPLAPHIQAAIHHLERETPSQNQVAAMLYLIQSLRAAISDADSLSPRLQRFFKRMEKSRIIQKVDVGL